MGGKGKQIKSGKAHQKPSKSSNFFNQQNATFGENKLMTFDMSNSFGGIKVDENSKANFEIDSNLEITFKKMTKKDPTTKLKALKDFVANLQQLEINEKAIEIFGKLYIQLSMDVDNLVRENAQNALMAMIVVDKISSDSLVIRRIFPYLLISMYDTHAVTATLAQNCFQKVFSSKNVSDILTICQEDVLENFTKNLTVLNAQTICNTHSFTPEECQAKYERVVIGSLKGYGMYIEKIPKDKLEELKEQNSNLIQNERFLSLYKSKSPYIKAAYYEVISNLLLHAPELLKSVETKLAALVFKSIDESDPSISSHVWSCVLLTQIKIDKWWTYINIKLFLEKLSTILKSCNNAKLIFPNLLPLISNFKTVFHGSQLEVFHANLMKNLHHGLTNEKQSERLKSEFSSIITAYYEVLHFIIMQIINDENMSDEEKIKLSNRYMDDYIIATIFWCLNNKKGSFPRKLVYQQIAKIVNFFSNNRTNHDLYDQLFNRFWIETYQILSNGMETNQELKSTSLTHVEFIKNILPPIKKHVRMEREDSRRDDKTRCLENQSSLRILVQKLCRVYIDKISVTLDIHLVESLKIFIEDYQSTELFQYLLQEFDYKSVYELYGIFESWLQEEMQCESAIDIITILFKYMNDFDKSKLLCRWNDMKSEQKNWMLLKMLEEPLCGDIIVKEFLRSSKVSNHITECAKIASTSGDNFEVLRKIFQPTIGKLLITHETCLFIVNTMCKTIRDSASTKALDKCGKYLIDIFPIISDKKDLQVQVFLAFFECSLNNNIDNEELLWSMISAWQDAINDGTLQIDKTLLEACILITNENIENLQHLSSSRLEYIALNISKLMKSIAKDDDCNDILSKLIELLMADSEHYKYLYEICFHLETIHGKVFPRKSINFQFENLNFELVLNDFIKSNLITINVLLMATCDKFKALQNEEICQQKNNDDDDDDDDSEKEIHEDISLRLYRKLLFEEEYSQRKSKNAIFLNKLIEIAKYDAIFSTLKKYRTKLDVKQLQWISYFEEKVKTMLSILNDDDINELLKVAPDCLNLLMKTTKYSGEIRSLFEDSNAARSELNNFKMYEAFVDANEKKILPLSLLRQGNSDIGFNVAVTRLFIKNHLDVVTSNEVEDLDIIAFSLNLFNEIIVKQKTAPFLLYKKDLNEDTTEDVLSICSIMNFLCEIITAFPTKLNNETQWDFLRLALSNWTLTLKRSYEKFHNIKVQAFIISIYKLNSAMLNFVELEKTKSSSQLISSVIDEWQAIFATDVNTILLQVFIDIVAKSNESSKCQELFMDALCHHISIDFYGIFHLRSSTISLKDSLNFAIKNLRNDNVSVCIVASKFINKVKKQILKSDQELLIKNNSKYGDDDVVPSDWHTLELFKETLESCQVIIEKHLDISSLRLSENHSVTTIPSDIAFTYLLLWNCILNICADSPIDLRSVYINWISTSRFHEILFSSLFNMMPRSVVKNPDMCTQLGFASFSPNEPLFEEKNIGRIAAFLYSKALRVIPVLVRKWWNGSDSKFAQIVDKVTTNYVSPILSSEELNALIAKKEKDGNMNIRVLMNSREVIATYGIENAKMELQLKLANNHPLGVIKVESKKHLGGKLQGFEIVKQLSIYLSHQNGRLTDGIAIWKRNLDKKYDGVEECFICYSVVQLENLQLPKLSCKACKKKFHSTCLYRWFSSSNKSTCPLCRSDF